MADQKQKNKTAKQQAVSQQNIITNIVQKKIKDAVQQQVKDVVPKAVKQQTQQTVKDAVQQQVKDVVPKAVKQQVKDVVPKAVQQKTQQQLKDIVALPQSFQNSVKRMIQQINTQQAQLIRKVFRDVANGKPVNKREILPKFHPDRVKGKQQAFKLLNNILSNPDQFKKYTRGMLRILDSAQKGKQQSIDPFSAMTSPRNSALEAALNQADQLTRIQKQKQAAQKIARQAANAAVQGVGDLFQRAQQQAAQKAQRQAARKKICDKLKQQRVLK